MNACVVLQNALCNGHMNVAWFFLEEAGARNLGFFRAKWLQVAMKGTLSVPRLRLRSFRARIGSPLAFCNVRLLMCS